MTVFSLSPHAYTVLKRFIRSATIPGSSRSEIPKHFFPASLIDAPM